MAGEGTPEIPEFMHRILDKENWTEFLYFFVYDPLSQTGMTVHMGREPMVPQIWRAPITIFLPDDELLVVRCYGGDWDPCGPKVGPLDVKCVVPEKHWRVTFDGVAQATTRRAVLNEPHTERATEPIRFELDFEAAAPLWTPQSPIKTGTGTVFSYHAEQICRVRGMITCRGQTIAINGYGVRDHSSGIRHYSNMIGHYWTNVLFDSGDAFMVATLSTQAGRSGFGYFYDAETEMVSSAVISSGPEICTLDSMPRSLPADLMVTDETRCFQLSIEIEGTLRSVTMELIHAVAATSLPPSEEYHGTDPISNPYARQYSTYVLRAQHAEDTGYGVFERSARISAIKLPSRS